MIELGERALSRRDLVVDAYKNPPKPVPYLHYLEFTRLLLVSHLKQPLSTAY